MVGTTRGIIIMEGTTRGIIIIMEGTTRDTTGIKAIM
eukprot:gene256-96_t